MQYWLHSVTAGVLYGWHANSSYVQSKLLRRIRSPGKWRQGNVHCQACFSLDLLT
eukprot:SAG11_NODE_34984_length_269_cov_0.594118_1_plen_54_part_10